MNIANRIKSLRKVKGITQEELADKLGVSRQAVSKWESEQSTPDLERVVIMSEFFEVTTDYILKGTDEIGGVEKNSNEIISRILYITSTVFIIIGLLCALGGWYENYTLDAVWGSMIIQAVGVAAYFIGKALSSVKPTFWVDWSNLIIGLFMPVSICSGLICRFLSWGKIIAPYPMEIRTTAIFVVIYVGVLVVSFIIRRNYKRKQKH